MMETCKCKTKSSTSNEWYQTLNEAQDRELTFIYLIILSHGVLAVIKAEKNYTSWTN